MNLAKSISQHTPELLALLTLLSIGLIAVIWQLARRLRRLESAWNVLLRDVQGIDLESQLRDHFDERRQLMRDHDVTRQRVESLEDKMETSKRHLGVVRYDAFDDVGGSQSFALAVYDDKGDGAVITSLVGRLDCRVYCKPLTRGRSERTLSQEEQRAIEEAERTAPRPIIAS